MTQLSSHQRDRAIGAITASAAGDALGAPYEFKPPLSEDIEVSMSGGGLSDWEPGEWTDDTAMAIAILEGLSRGESLADEDTQDRIVARWSEWALTANDVGIQTRNILSAIDEPTAQEAYAVAENHHLRTGMSAGNGSLMRTGPVALGSLDSELQTAKNARAISKLTHWDDDAGDACVLWSLAIRHAILTGEIDIRKGLPFVSDPSQWEKLISEAESQSPSSFSKNGWVVHAFQAAYSAINMAISAPESNFTFRAERLAYGIEQAVRAGFDTDTVAAIAGSLLGAGFGHTAIPSKWRLPLHGWPNLTENQLARLAALALNGGEADPSGWPVAPHFDYSEWSASHEFAQHPLDEKLWIGGVDRVQSLPDEVSAVVSLCRMGTDDVPKTISKHLEVLLIDKSGAAENLNPTFTILQAAQAVQKLREEGHTVYLHCVQAQSRTPSVAAAYSMLLRTQSADDALAGVSDSLPRANPNPTFLESLSEIAEILGRQSRLKHL